MTIPLNRCIHILDYTEKLSEKQREAIKFYLNKLRLISKNENNGFYTLGSSEVRYPSQFKGVDNEN